MKSEFDYHWENWAKNHSCIAKYYFEPKNEEEIISIVKKASALKKKIRIVGTGHSFSPIALSDDILISLQKYRSIISTDTNSVAVQGGIYLHELYHHLKTNDLALHNYGVINKQTIAGALSTGTHGSGLKYKSLSSAIIKIRLIKADGTIEIIQKNSKIKIGDTEYSLWEACSVSLGMLGIISEVTLACEPLYYLRSEEKTVDFSDYINHMDEWSEEYDYFKGWWFPHTDKVYVYLTKRITNEEYSSDKKNEVYSDEQRNRDARMDQELSPEFIASLENKKRIPEINQKALEHYFTNRIRYDNCFDILVHEETVPMIVSEFGLSMENNQYKNALLEFRELTDKENNYLHFPVDLRFSDEENSWLSPACKQKTFYIGMCVREYHQKTIPPIMNLFIALMKKHQGKPNWGKIFDHTKNELTELFPKMNDFITLRKQLDPEEKFLNKDLKNWFG